MFHKFKLGKNRTARPGEWCRDEHGILIRCLCGYLQRLVGAKITEEGMVLELWRCKRRTCKNSGHIVLEDMRSGDET